MFGDKKAPQMQGFKVYLGSVIRGWEGRIGEMGLGVNHQKESIII